MIQPSRQFGWVAVSVAADCQVQDDRVRLPEFVLPIWIRRLIQIGFVEYFVIHGLPSRSNSSDHASFHTSADAGGTSLGLWTPCDFAERKERLLEAILAFEEPPSGSTPLCETRNWPRVLDPRQPSVRRIDGRQVVGALRIGEEAARTPGFQYIVTLNEDDALKEREEDFDWNDYVLPVRLTDSTEEGGLFGIRFD